MAYDAFEPHTKIVPPCLLAHFLGINLDHALACSPSVSFCTLPKTMAKLLVEHATYMVSLLIGSNTPNSECHGLVVPQRSRRGSNTSRTGNRGSSSRQGTESSARSAGNQALPPGSSGGGFTAPPKVKSVKSKSVNWKPDLYAQDSKGSCLACIANGASTQWKQSPQLFLLTTWSPWILVARTLIPTHFL